MEWNSQCIPAPELVFFLITPGSWTVICEYTWCLRRLLPRPSSSKERTKAGFAGKRPNRFICCCLSHNISLVTLSLRSRLPRPCINFTKSSCSGRGVFVIFLVDWAVANRRRLWETHCLPRMVAKPRFKLPLYTIATIKMLPYCEVSPRFRSFRVSYLLHKWLCIHETNGFNMNLLRVNANKCEKWLEKVSKIWFNANLDDINTQKLDSHSPSRVLVSVRVSWKWELKSGWKTRKEISHGYLL